MLNVMIIVQRLISVLDVSAHVTAHGAPLMLKLLLNEVKLGVRRAMAPSGSNQGWRYLSELP